MPNIPKKVSDRLVAGLKQFQPILSSAKSRDINEADTVTIVKDMLGNVFGYDKYAEVTSEYAIRGTYCDLATKVDGRLATLIEVKAIGIELKDQHVKQAVDYAANQGVDWVLLTNAVTWRVYHIKFTKPIEQELIVDINFLDLSAKQQASLELLFLWCKEGWAKSALGEYQTQKEALSRYTIGAVLLSESVLDLVRRELRKISPEVKIDNEEIHGVMLNDVIKREVLEGEKALEARKRLSRIANAQSKLREQRSITAGADAASTGEAVRPANA